MNPIHQQLQDIVEAANLSQKTFKIALVRAINETMRSLKAATVKASAQNSGIQAKLFRERTLLIQARLKKLEGGISTIVTTIPAILLDATQTQMGVVIRGGTQFKQAFISTTRRGPFIERVYRRKYLDRYSPEHPGYPITEMRVPIRDDVEAAQVVAASKVNEKFLKNLARHLKLQGGLI